MKKRLAVWGWWQGGNLGDNWIKRTIARLFPEAEFVYTTTQNFSAYDFVICGGGGLFIYNAIAPWINYSQKTPYGALGLGAEFPHTTDQAYKLSRNAKFFYVRDKYSLDCMKIDDIERSYDITFADPLEFIKQEDLNPDKLFFVWRGGRELLPNPQFKKYLHYEEKTGEYRKIIAEEFKDIIYDDFQTRQNNIEQRINGCGFVISGRFHGIVAAIHKGIPCIGIDLCPKIRTIMKDCGLEEYCIKISETDKLGMLINKAKNESEAIRKKQCSYRKKAADTLLKQIDFAKAEIDKALNPMRILHYGSYWMKDNDVVKAMADDLAKAADAVIIDLKAYSADHDSRIKSKVTTPNGMLCTLDTKKIEEDIINYKPDAIVLNSGGLVLEDSGFKMLAEKKIVTVGIELSDPDVFRYNGALYADKFDIFYTNSKYSLENQYDSKRVNIKHLPFAASVDHHYYLPKIEKKYDIVVVGHARISRSKVTESLRSKFSVGLYGHGWQGGLGPVSGANNVRAINSGKMYLSFAPTLAGYENVKVGLFEAVACNQVVITKHLKELEELFEADKEIICYKDESEIPGIIEYYLTHEEEREAIRENAYHRFLREHTYVNRWKKIKKDISDKMLEKLKL